MFKKQWINSILVGLLILFSLPLKLPALQQMLESWFSYSFPIRLSLYTLFLPPVALFSIVWNRKRTIEILEKFSLHLSVLVFLFGWMWLGAFLSEYPNIALKHSGRYSIYLLTFLAFLFALNRESLKKSGQIFTGIYLILSVLTYLDWSRQLSILGLLADLGLSIDLFESHALTLDNVATYGPTSFFENRNPYAIASVGVFFWSLASLRHYLILPSLGIAASLYSILFIATSRNGFLTLIVCLLILLIFSLKQFRKAPKFFSFVLATVIVVGISYFTHSSETIIRTNKSINRLLDVKKYKDLEKFDLRFVIFRSALELGISNPPILGSGTKTFGNEVFSKSKDMAFLNSPWYKNAFNAHNALLTIWIEMGVVGLIAVLFFLWIWLRLALRGPPLLMMPVLAVCVGQILDYFVWEILFMTFQSFFFAHLAATITFQDLDHNNS